MQYHEVLDEIGRGILRPVYLVYGEEGFLVEEVYRALRAAVVHPETADFNFHVLEPGPDQLSQALSLAQTQPFFAEKRLVVVKECPAIVPRRRGGSDEQAPADAGDAALLGYLKAPVASTVLLFLAAQVDVRRKTTKALMAAGAAVECRPLKPEDAAMWAQRRAQSEGKRLGGQAAHLLVERVGTDLGLLARELEKLVLYVGPAGEIRAADVETMVSAVAETEIFRLSDAVLRRERARAVALLERLLQQVDHPLQLLSALTGRFRQLLLVKALAARRLSPKEAAQLAHMHPYAYGKLAEHAATVDRAEIVRALKRLLEADLAIKSGYDPRLTLETVVAELVGEQG
ncbi:DNA polymerase III subunit delta [Symbiobacterium thermophilum]|uniref:DNA polymerase III subunit delta n=1 Tax=Symbiobacterium thermophilum TaxID=2734 RepID=UPI0023572AF2|nr:DNA polymerase III subunit delta [Symbiobacterium thermophilum]